MLQREASARGPLGCERPLRCARARARVASLTKSELWQVLAPLHHQAGDEAHEVTYRSRAELDALEYFKKEGLEANGSQTQDREEHSTPRTQEPAMSDLLSQTPAERAADQSKISALADSLQHLIKASDYGSLDRIWEDTVKDVIRRRLALSNDIERREIDEKAEELVLQRMRSQWKSDADIVAGVLLSTDPDFGMEHQVRKILTSDVDGQYFLGAVDAERKVESTDASSPYAAWLLKAMPPGTKSLGQQAAPTAAGAKKRKSPPEFRPSMAGRVLPWRTSDISCHIDRGTRCHGCGLSVGAKFTFKFESISTTTELYFIKGIPKF
eukprot:SAG31_NODE_4596_length_3105_cov_4.885562_2_plen_326_part_00